MVSLKRSFSLIVLTVTVISLFAFQFTSRTTGLNGGIFATTLPARCSSGDFSYLTSGSVGMYYCNSPNTWIGPLGQGTSYTMPATIAAHQTFIATGATSVAAKTINDCTGASKAITFSQASDSFGCNTISGTSSFVDWQKQTSGISIANGSDTTIFSTSITGGTIAAGHCLTVTANYHFTNTLAHTITVKLKFGAAVFQLNSTTSDYSNGVNFVPQAFICNNPGATNAQQVTIPLIINAMANTQFTAMSTFLAIATGLTTSAIDTTATQTLALTMQSSGNGDTGTGDAWKVDNN